MYMSCRVKTREELAVWVCSQHNLVNQKLGKVVSWLDAFFTHIVIDTVHVIINFFFAVSVFHFDIIYMQLYTCSLCLIVNCHCSMRDGEKATRSVSKRTKPAPQFH